MNRVTFSERNELRNTIERCARQWFLKGQSSYYLLEGEFLNLAKQFYRSPGNRLSANALEFILASIELDKKTHNLNQGHRQLITASLTATMAVISTFILSTASWNILTLEAEISLDRDRPQQLG